jgi:vitamin B12 transporter
MNHHSTSRIPGWSLTAFACAMLSAAHAQETATAYPATDHDTVRMDRYVVSASRMPQDPSLVPSSVTVVPLNELALAQIDNLSTALAQTPGVTVATYGGVGGQTNIYIRGSSTAQTLVVVDGIRMSSRQTDFFGKSILGGMSMGGLERVEVLRGPQGTLYGSSAMGGVISLETTHGCGTPSGYLALGAGSLESYGASASVQGGTKTLGYSAAVGYAATANDRPMNDDKQLNFSSRIEEKLTSQVLLGATIRGIQGRYEEAGPVDYFSPGKADSNGLLGTVYSEFSADDSLKSRLTFGWHQTDYTWTDLSGSPWASNSYYRSTRDVLDWQNNWLTSKTISVVAGLSGEWSHYRGTNTTATLKDKSRSIYASSDIHPIEPLSLTLGARYDDFDTSGDATTGRVGFAWRFSKTNTKVRATLGTGFNAPSLTEIHGDSTWYVPSPDLRPEKSTGWDVGIDQTFLGGDLSVEATYFYNKYRDMIVANQVPGGWLYQYQNIVRARTEGLELATSYKLTPTVKIRAGATYLDAYDTTSGRSRIAYKPRRSADVDVQWQVLPNLLVGAGYHHVADRMRTATAPIGDYSVARAYASYEVVTNLWLKARVENALNERYGEIYGYPSLPRRYSAGVEWKF